MEQPKLNEGEIYVGAIITPDGSRNHHIILLPGESDEIEWKAANEWAASIGGELPDRVEGALLFATQKDQFKPDYYWTRDPSSDKSDYAWFQNFYFGNQNGYRKSQKLYARAVRRVEVK